MHTVKSIQWSQTVKTDGLLIEVRPRAGMARPTHVPSPQQNGRSLNTREWSSFWTRNAVHLPFVPTERVPRGGSRNFRKGGAGSRILERGGRNLIFQCRFPSFSYKSLTNIPPKRGGPSGPSPKSAPGAWLVNWQGLGSPVLPEMRIAIAGSSNWTFICCSCNVIRSKDPPWWSRLSNEWTQSVGGDPLLSDTNWHHNFEEWRGSICRTQFEEFGNCIDRSFPIFFIFIQVANQCGAL